MSNNIWFTSDNHWYHKNVIQYCKRPFSSVEEMNEVMIGNWNKVVKSNDVIYHLGDVSLASNLEVLTSRLNGYKILVPGNHDKVHPINAKTPTKYFNQVNKYANWGWHVVSEYYVEPCIGLELCHFPFASDRSDERHQDYRPKYNRQVLLCGHVHEKWKTYFIKDKLAAINVGVDQWNFTPVHLDIILEVIKNNGVE